MGQAYWKYTAAKRKADQLKRELKTIVAHYSSLKNTLKECANGELKYFSKYTRYRNSGTSAAF